MNQNIQKIFILVAAGLAHEVALGMQHSQEMQVCQYDTQRTQRTSSASSRSGVDSDGNGDYVDFSDGDDDTEERKINHRDSTDGDEAYARQLQQEEEELFAQEQRQHLAHRLAVVEQKVAEKQAALKQQDARVQRSSDALNRFMQQHEQDARREDARNSQAEGKEDARSADIGALEEFEGNGVEVEVKKNSPLSTATKAVVAGATIGGIGYAASKPEVREAVSVAAKDICRQS